MNDSIRKAKDRGAELLAKGKLKAALEQYQLVIRSAPKEVGARQKVAEVLVKLGQPKEAVPHFQAVSDAYAQAGQFFKAIAICKVILGLDPAHTAAQDNLTKLYGVLREPTQKALPVKEALGAQVFKAAAPPPAVVEEVRDEDIIEVEAVDEAAPMLGASPLPTIPLFSELTPTEFKAVLSGAVEACVFSDGEAIVTEGSDGSSMFAICEGDVSVQRPSPTGPREVARMREGDIFGELGLVFGAPRLATVVAKGEVIALEFQRSAMEEVQEAHPGIRTALERFYRERLLANLLRASPLFEPLSQETRSELVAAFELRTFLRGQVLVEQGAHSDGLFMLLRGTCEVFDVSKEKYPEMGEGAHFGEISVILDKPATATVRAASTVTVLKLPAGVFKAKVLSHPVVKEVVTKQARERLERTNAVLMKQLGVELV